MKFGFQFCPKCGAPLEERTIGDQIEPACTRAACGYIFWQNSKPCTCAVIENDCGEVLLCKRKHEPDAGKFGEHPHDAIHREIQEELGVKIDIESALGFVMDWYDGKDVATLNIPFVAHIVEGTPTPNDDVAAIQWKRLEDINRADLAFRNNETILFDLYARYRT